MVVGEVQSGKTSNYIELACKAVDAGYRFVVVLTGSTNSLRAQTQLRFDEGFLGWDTRLNLQLGSSNRRVGVGALLGESLYGAISPTNASENGDFNLRVANHYNIRLGGDPVIMVVKKNGSVLRNLTRWARSVGQGGTDAPIPNTPLLVIDDEADYASVNTRPVGAGDDEDPTVINGRIRELLSTFEQRVYVGYTATALCQHLHLSRPGDRRPRTGPISPRLPGEPPGAQQSCGTDEGVRPSGGSRRRRGAPGSAAPDTDRR